MKTQLIQCDHCRDKLDPSDPWVQVTIQRFGPGADCKRCELCPECAIDVWELVEHRETTNAGR